VPATDDRGKQAMCPPIGIDSLDAGTCAGY